MITTEDRYFKRGIGISVGAHLLILLFFLVNIFYVKKPTLDLSQAIRVDMVGLPDKIDSLSLPDKVQEKPAPIAEKEKPETQKLEKLPPKTKPVTAADNTAINLNKVKNKQKEALEKLKKLSAIDKIKQELSKEELAQKQLAAQEAAKKAVAKGRIISPGTTLGGLEKIEAQKVAFLWKNVR